MDNLKIAKEFLADKKSELKTWHEKIEIAESEYVGKRLEIETKNLIKWLEETQVEIEALEDYIDKIEM